MGSLSEVTARIPAQRNSGQAAVREVEHDAEGVRVTLEFDVESAPVLQVGRGGSVVFARGEAGGQEETLRAVGKVIRRNDPDGKRIYELLFGDMTRQSLAYLLEPRRSFRAYPDEHAPVIASIRTVGDDDNQLMCPIRDISITGIGVEVPWECESWLCNADSVQIALLFPEDDAEVSIRGRIRGRAVGSSCVVYGFQFDELKSTDRELELIAAYVMSRAGGLASDDGVRRASA